MSNDCGFSSRQFGQTHGAASNLLSIAASASTTMRLASTYSWSFVTQTSAGGRNSGTAVRPENSFWIVAATSWNLLSGYAGYFSFGHGAFFGAGVYTSATLSAKFNWPFLWTLPMAALVAAVIGVSVGAIAFVGLMNAS